MYIQVCTVTGRYPEIARSHRQMAEGVYAMKVYAKVICDSCPLQMKRITKNVCLVLMSVMLEARNRRQTVKGV